MEFLIFLTVLIALCMTPSSYRQLKSGAYQPEQTVRIVLFLAGYLGFSWLGMLAWEQRLPSALAQGPLGAVASLSALLLFGALFVAPALLGVLVAQALAAVCWWCRDQRA